MNATEKPEVPLKLKPRIDTTKLKNAGETVLERFKSELATLKSDVERQNNIGDTGLLPGLFGTSWGASNFQNNDTAAQPWTLSNANSYNPVSLNRILLSYSYMTEGLLRTVCDQPVDDAFRGGVKFKSSQLGDDELAQLNLEFKKQRSRESVKGTKIAQANSYAGVDLTTSDQGAVKQTMIWARLFGGAGMIINTNQAFQKELNRESIGEDSPLSFIAADRWELTLSSVNTNDQRVPTPFNYYGLPLNRSRVCQMNWAEAPSYIRTRLQGWGMSVMEECIRPINMYLKFEKLLFELLDEAKIDVFKIKGFNTSLGSAKGTQSIQMRTALANQQKNFQSALSMDMEDDYIQKQLTFSGIPEIYEQLRISLCAYLKMPMNKVFGQSAGGFGSGKDSLDNYNAIVEHVREKANPLVVEAGSLRCQQLFGMVPDDLEAEFFPLDVLDGVEQETVKTSKQTRIMEQFSVGLLTGQEACEALMKEGLLLVECEVLLGLRDVEPPPTQNPDEAAAQQEGAEKLLKIKGSQKPQKKAA